MVVGRCSANRGDAAVFCQRLAATLQTYGVCLSFLFLVWLLCHMQSANQRGLLMTMPGFLLYGQRMAQGIAGRVKPLVKQAG